MYSSFDTDISFKFCFIGVSLLLQKKWISEIFPTFFRMGPNFLGKMWKKVDFFWKEDQIRG